MADVARRKIKIYRLSKPKQKHVYGEYTGVLAPALNNVIAENQYEEISLPGQPYIYAAISDRDLLTQIEGSPPVRPPAPIEEGAWSSFRINTDPSGARYIVGQGGIKFYLLTTATSALTEADQLPNEYEFYINPARITPTYSKLITEVRTKGGWEIQHWGNNLTELAVQGKSGALLYGTDSTVSRGLLAKDSPLYESVAWKKLMGLKKLYELDHSIPDTEQNWEFGLTYFDRFYLGYFTNFTGPEVDAENPYIVTYSFTFKVRRELDLSIVRRSIE